MWLGGIVVEERPSVVGGAIWEMDGCSCVFDEDVEVWSA